MLKQDEEKVWVRREDEIRETTNSCLINAFFTILNSEKLNGHDTKIQLSIFPNLSSF